MRKISNKIILAITLCSFLSAIAVGGISLYKSQQVVNQESEEKMTYMAKSYANEFNLLLKDTKNNVDGLALAVANEFKQGKVETFNSRIDDEVRHYSESTDGSMAAYVYLDVERFKGVYGSWYLDEKGDGTMVKQEMEGADSFDPEDESMDWYYTPMKERKGIWSSPYVDQGIDVKMISYTTPLIINGDVIGMVGMDIKFELFEKSIKDIKVYETGYAYIMDSNFNFLIHPSFSEKDNLKKIENGSLSFLASKMKKDKEGYLAYTYKGEEKMVAYDQLVNGWYVGIAPVKAEIEKGIDTIKLWILTIVVLAIVMSILGGSYLGNLISKPIKKLTEAVKNVAAGDLTINITSSSKDEVGTLTKGFQSMTENMRETLQYLLDSAKRVSIATEDLHSSSEHTSKATEQITASIQEIASGSSRQLESITGGRRVLVALEEMVEEITNSTATVSKDSGETSLLANKGNSEVRKAAEQMNSIHHSISNLSDVVSVLGDSSQEIGRISELIANLAAQTNLLSLNAAIEASRAGEHGKGFAVVASEVRKLAEQSTLSAGQISGYIEKIQQNISLASRYMASGKEEVENGINIVDTVGDTFQEIQSSVERVSRQIVHVHELTKEIASGTDLSKAIMVIEQVANANADDTQSASAFTEEQLASMEEISSAAESLSEMANELLNATNRFKVE